MRFYVLDEKKNGLGWVEIPFWEKYYPFFELVDQKTRDLKKASCLMQEWLPCSTD